ncbi:MAG: histidinol-phosphate transaminase [Bacillota bacterium]
MDNRKAVKRLDLNQNPYDIAELLSEELNTVWRSIKTNEYPDGSSCELRKAIASYAGIEPECIVTGNGSDELLMLIMQTFVSRGDRVLTFVPTFSMYRQYALKEGALMLEYSTGGDFNLDIDGFINFRDEHKPKLQIICNPNNPSGGLLSMTQLESLLKGFKGITVIDEAYYEFSKVTAVPLLERNKKLLITRTFSKAMGLAGLRIGYILGSSGLTEQLERVRSPYNLNAFSQAAAVAVLKNYDKVQKTVSSICGDRDYMYNRIKLIDGIMVFKSYTNFLLLQSSYCSEIEQALLAEGIRIRRFREPELSDCLRIAVGRSEDNSRIIEIMEAIAYGK